VKRLKHHPVALVPPERDVGVPKTTSEVQKTWAVDTIISLTDRNEAVQRTA